MAISCYLAHLNKYTALVSLYPPPLLLHLQLHLTLKFHPYCFCCHRPRILQVNNLLFPQPSCHPCSRTPLHCQTQLQYRPGCNVLDYDVMTEEGVCLNLLLQCFCHGILQRRVYPPPNYVPKRLHH